MGRHRPWLAAVLALLVVGLGHVYLRRWRRAALWFAVILGSGVALSSTFADPSAAAGPTDLPLVVVVPILGLYGVSAADAYRIARETARQSAVVDEGGGAGAGPPPTGDPPEAEAPACPHCGKEVDPDLDFCTWCTEPLVPDDAE
ncbi:MAG: zinc ribbon domain-containing protein [Haloferacaceae archaeon]